MLKLPKPAKVVIVIEVSISIIATCVIFFSLLALNWLMALIVSAIIREKANRSVFESLLAR